MKPSLLLGNLTHQEMASLLRDRHRLVISGAANETAKSMLLSHILFLDERPAVLVTEDETHVEALAHWLHFFGRESHKIMMPPDAQIGVLELASFLNIFLARGTTVLTKDIWQLEAPLFSELEKRKIQITQGDTIDFNAFFSDLIDRGYSHGEDQYLQPGEYRRIGDTLDIYPVGSNALIRILFSFERVEKIVSVDRYDLSKTQDHADICTIYPLNWEKTAALWSQIPRDTLVAFDDQDDLPENNNDLLLFTAFPEDEKQHIHVRYLSVLKFYTLPDFLNDVRDKLKQDWFLLIVTKRGEELEGILKEENIPFTEKPEHKRGALTIVGSGDDELMPHSIQNPDLKIAMLTDREIFTLRKETKQRSIQRLALDFITSLQGGDFVVHMEHGIGRFEGMTQKFIDGLAREYLEIHYADNDKLFVPVDQADKLSKFVHEEGSEPQLTRLGSSEWKRVTKKISEETERIAKELLDLYARRAKAKGFAFEEDKAAQQRFEEAFPFQETPGQMKAIEDIKHDMESPHVMDRLICGDVGFGKTEVAMRAAFKSVQSGKQVAFVSPITILANQHYENMIDRMKGFPVRIEMLSRFRTPAEQKEILEKLRKGDIDIIIGTHRLLQEDVEFFNLGLVIIDEEQRFGVKQKEQLKSLRASVDMLTMTATPIPRTLNLGLHKLRDITTITTPPPGRLPIITEVRKYSDSLMRQAIESELKRDGQVYVLHNRVETIEAFAAKLKSLIPSAKIVVTHGQLKPELLEERIGAFKDGTFNVLVSSTIIENGIDLPRANTLIVNEAEKFGLSQLYQLRGRVGRGKIQAYAYFLYHSQRLKDDAKKRLRAIVEASELGSGFQIAMRDLEIRGAGEILGASQSGNMQTVGVSHYLRLLKQAVENLKAGGKGAAEEDLNVEILLPIEAFLPAYFIPDEQEKISVYQKLAGSESEQILAEFEEDLREEYGPPPQAVINLFQILRLKMASRRAGVSRVKMEKGNKLGDEIVLTLSSRVTAKEIMQLLAEESAWRISGATLRAPLELLKKNAPGAWIEYVTKNVALLSKKQVKQKTSDD